MLNTKQDILEVWLSDLQFTPDDDILEGVVNFINNTKGFSVDFDEFCEHHDLFNDEFDTHPQYDDVYMALGL